MPVDDARRLPTTLRPGDAVAVSVERFDAPVATRSLAWQPVSTWQNLDAVNALAAPEPASALRA